ncbi:hypothetical protein Tco_0601088 [Tanacetum coccineum]
MLMTWLLSLKGVYIVVSCVTRLVVGCGYRRGAESLLLWPCTHVKASKGAFASDKMGEVGYLEKTFVCFFDFPGGSGGEKKNYSSVRRYVAVSSKIETAHERIASWGEALKLLTNEYVA